MRGSTQNDLQVALIARLPFRTAGRIVVDRDSKGRKSLRSADAVAIV